MTPDTARQIVELDGMPVRDLRRMHIDLFGEDVRSHNKDFLRKRLAWRLQARDEGGISDRARKRAKALADEADLRVRSPRDPFADAKAALAAGASRPFRRKGSRRS